MKETSQITFPFNGQDRFNYLARYGTSNTQIQAAILFEEPLNVQILEKAVRLSIDAEPILSCGLVEEEAVPFWSRFENLDDIKWFEYVTSIDLETSLLKFYQQPIGLNGQQQLFVQLICHKDKHIVAIKMNHASTDGGGLKIYISLLAQIYTSLCEDINYTPPFNSEVRRDQKGYFESLGITEPLALFNPEATAYLPTWAFPHDNFKEGEMVISNKQIKGEDYQRLILNRKAQGVTINTLLLTAYYRALFRLINPSCKEDMEVYVTKDLRSDCKEIQTICNLSSMLPIRITRLIDENFLSTMERVDEAIKKLKEEDKGLTTALTFEALGFIEFKQAKDALSGARIKAIESGKCTPLLSNIGIIKPIVFAGNEAINAYIVTPYMHAPGFMLGVSTYKDVLTLVVSYSEASTKQDVIEQFLNQMCDELASI